MNALGGGTLSDIFDTEERGQMLGTYYGLPLLGPALGPLLGGALTAVADWRATFYFLLGNGVVYLGLALWLPETFRKERSLAWQKAMKQAIAQAAATRELSPPESTLVAEIDQDGVPFKLQTSPTKEHAVIRLRDINPFTVIGEVLSQRYNLLTIVFSAFLFASQSAIALSTSRTFAASPYNYNALEVGLVLLSFGTGNLLGSVAGGKYSDRVFLRLKAKNNGVGEPEMRIRSTLIALCLMPPLLVAFA